MLDENEKEEEGEREKGENICRGLEDNCVKDTFEMTKIIGYS